MDDERIIELYFQRNEDAIKYTNETYGKRLFHLADNITKNDEDAEECVNSTYMKTWNTIPPQCPSFFFAYIAKICRHLALDRFDWNKAAKRQAEIVSLSYELEMCIPDSRSKDELQAKELGAILDSFLHSVTFQGYRLMANAQVIPYFEKTAVRLGDVDRESLQRFFDEKASTGRKDGKGGLSPSSLRQYKNILMQTLNEAVKSGLIQSNPCQFVELPKKQQYQSSYYNAEQLKALFEAIEDDPLYPVVKITALYGLRRSEVLGLKWDSVDFSTGRLTIKRTVSKVTTTVCKDKTKNSSSHRSFPLSHEAKEILLQIKADEDIHGQLCGSEYQENDFIFKWPNGKPFSPDYISSHFSLLLKNNHLPHIRFHELRHSCASLLLNSGFTLKDVQEYMGHSDIQMTANIYGHLDTQRKNLLTEKITASIF